MSNYHYDEAATVAQLSPLPRRLLVLPALLAATRLLPATYTSVTRLGAATQSLSSNCTRRSGAKSRMGQH